LKDSSKFTLRFYLAYVKQHKVLFTVSLIAIPAASLIINTAVPYFFSQAIGQLASSQAEQVYSTLKVAAVTGAAGVLFNFVGFQALTRQEANVGAKIRLAAFRQLMGKDSRFFVNQKIGAMTGKYIDFFRGYVVIQDLLIIRTLGFCLSLIAGLTILGSKSLLLAGLLLALLIMLVAEVKWSLKKREPWRETRKKYRSELFGKIADSLSNNVIVKSFGNEQVEISDAAKSNDTFRQAFIKDIGFLAAEGTLRIAILITVQVATVSTSAYLVGQGDIDIATAIFGITYLQLIGSQIFSIGELLNGYEQALLDASPMSEMLTTKNVINDKPSAKTLHKFKPTITLKSIYYRYDDGINDVLKDISLQIPAGQKVGLVGQSGSGKTTLSHLILRFSDVTSGAIKIDDIDVRDISQQSLRRSVAYVPQESSLFHRSLRQNIAYGKPDATDQEIIAAAKQANAWEFIAQLPEGLDTIVGERGVKLSGGQRQRIAIARAILKDSPILVLDEATSALDSESEKLIQVALEKLMHNRTSIVIAHRLSTIAKLDRIIVLDKGVVAEDGSHKELLRKNGIYAKLWKHQSGGFLDK
jgi:ATP-binding cassette subfamily B protein